MTGTLSVQRRAADLREGDVIKHLDGEPAEIINTHGYDDTHGWAYCFDFGPDRVPFASRGSEVFTKFIPIPKVGDLATLCYPSDRYPFIVVGVSKTGSKLTLLELDHRIVSGNFQSNNAVIEYSVDQNFARRMMTANWSPKRGIYTAGGTPVSIGNARYYQAPEV